ncbi:MAG: hypothetical protein AAF709_20020, partial [Pseudomonadota bacterium]
LLFRNIEKDAGSTRRSELKLIANYLTCIRKIDPNARVLVGLEQAMNCADDSIRVQVARWRVLAGCAFCDVSATLCSLLIENEFGAIDLCSLADNQLSVLFS